MPVDTYVDTTLPSIKIRTNTNKRYRPHTKGMLTESYCLETLIKVFPLSEVQQCTSADSGNGLENKFSFGEWLLDVEPFALRLDGLDAAHDRSHDSHAEPEGAYNFPADPLQIQRVHCPHHCALKARERCRGDTSLPWSLWTTVSSCARAPFWFRGM